MREILGMIDSSVKRWVIGLAVAAAIVIVVIARTVLLALAEPPSTPARALLGPLRPVEESRLTVQPAWTPAQSAWTSSQPSQDGGPGSALQTVSGVPSPSATPLTAAQRKADEIAVKQCAHQQAEYLRKVMSQPNPPSGLGHLTPERIDEMEKKGIGIW